MRNIIYVLVVGMLFSNCQKKVAEPKIVDSIQEKETINKLLDNWHKSAAEANFESYFNAMTSTSVFIGTDASENWKYEAFKKFSKPYFDKGKAWNFKALERTVYIKDEIAWFDELLATQMGICRGSGVLIKNNSSWKIAHYVLSLTIPNDNIDAVKLINKKKDSIFLKSLHK